MGLNYAKLTVLLFSVAFLAIAMMPLSYGKGVSEWALYGNVINGNTCNPIAGAVVSSIYNGNASNITNSNGDYLLRLGYGNWTITVSKAGYGSITFNTPYETGGAYLFDTYLLTTGTSAVNCTASLSAKNSTVPSTAPTSVSSTSPTTTVSSAQSASASSMNVPANLAVVLIIAVIIIAFLVGRSTGSKDRQHAPKGHQKDEKTQ